MKLNSIRDQLKDSQFAMAGIMMMTMSGDQMSGGQHHLAKSSADRLGYNFSSSSSEILERMEEEINAKRHLVSEVLPKELSSVQNYVNDLEEIESAPIGPELLEKINSRIEKVNREINSMMEKKMLRDDPLDDKLNIFRENVRMNSYSHRLVYQRRLTCLTAMRHFFYILIDIICCIAFFSAPSYSSSSKCLSHLFLLGASLTSSHICRYFIIISITPLVVFFLFAAIRSDYHSFQLLLWKITVDFDSILSFCWSIIKFHS